MEVKERGSARVMCNTGQAGDKSFQCSFPFPVLYLMVYSKRPCLATVIQEIPGSDQKKTETADQD